MEKNTKENNNYKILNQILKNYKKELEETGDLILRIIYYVDEENYSKRCQILIDFELEKTYNKTQENYYI
ncbi:MAG: hypothetical protein QW409_03885 [Candidatus Aenigmatarchaeota archaeon]